MHAKVLIRIACTRNTNGNSRTGRSDNKKNDLILQRVKLHLTSSISFDGISR
jgi:hypothetical protein